MSKRYTTESFREDMSKLYAEHPYDFSETNYVRSSAKVVVRCTLHGSFSKSANTLQQNKGHCPSCVAEATRGSRRKSHESFVSALRQIQPHIDIGDSLYETGETKMEVLCTKHSVKFSIKPTKLLIGQSCQHCKKEKIAANNKNTKNAEYFLSKAVEVHGELYDYSLVDYKTLAYPVEIVCKRCGKVFMQSPLNHINGCGCKSCKLSETKTLSTQDFIAGAVRVHGDKYDYSVAEYSGAHSKVHIGCNTCGKSFNQTATNHLCGQGCPNCGCTGYSPLKAGSFYVMTFGDFTKVGITNRTASKRAKELSIRNRWEYTVLRSDFYEDGNIAKELELKTLMWLKERYKNPTRKFEGSSESFMAVDHKELINFINTIKGTLP